MSEVMGNNPTTGESHPTVTAEQDAKAAAKAAAKAQSEAKALDVKFCKRITSIDSALVELGAMIDRIVESGAWSLLTDADGTPFKTWEDYVVARVRDNVATDPDTGKSLLSSAMSKAFIVLLRERGISVRKAAEAVKVSVGTASQADKESRGARTAGDGTQATPASAASKAVKQSESACKRVRDLGADMTLAELQQVVKDLKATAKVIDGLIRIREQVAAQHSSAAEVNAPKPSDVAAKAAA